jgi:hypothetical protein
MKSLILAALAALCLTGAAAPQTADTLLNTPSANWNVYGAAQTHKGVRDKTVQGGGAMRVTLAAKPANAWDAGASNAIDKPIRKGDKLMLAVWVRLHAGGAGGTTEIAAAIQRSTAPYAPIVNGRLAVTPEWKLVHIQGVADADYPAGAANIALSLGTNAHVVDLGPAFVLLVQ